MPALALAFLIATLTFVAYIQGPYASTTENAFTAAAVSAGGDTSGPAVSPDIANKQCEKPGKSDQYVFRKDKPPNAPFTENGKMYINLYKKPCTGPLVKAFCAEVDGEGKCDGKIAGSQCYDEGKWTACNTPKNVRVADAGGKIGGNVLSDADKLNPASKPGTETALPKENKTPGSTVTNDAYTTPKTDVPKTGSTNADTSASAVSTPRPSVTDRISEVGNVAPAAPTPSQSANTVNTPLPSGPALNPGTTQTLTPASGAAQAPASGTPAPLASASNRPASAQNTFPTSQSTTPTTPTSGANPTTPTNPTSPTTPTTQPQPTSPTNPTAQQPNTPSQPSHANPSNDSPSTRPSTATSRGQSVQNFFGGIASFFSGIVSGGSSQTTVVQNRVQYVPRPVVRPTTIVVQQSQPTNSPMPQPTQAEAPVRDPETTTRLQVRVPETPRVYIATTLDDGETIQIEVSRPTTTLGRAPLELPRLIDTSPREFTSSAAERTEHTTPTETPTLFIQGMGSSTESIRRAFVEKVAPSSASIKMADGFRAASTTPRASALVQVFHAISISDLLDAITQGSLDVIKRVLGRGEPETPLKVVQYDERPIAPTRGERPAALPPGDETSPTEEGGIAARAPSTVSNESVPRNAAVQRGFTERLRENPVSIFQGTAIVYQVHGHVPLMQAPRAFPDIVPVPQVSLWSAEERPRVFVALDSAFNGVKRWFGSIFSRKTVTE